MKTHHSKLKNPPRPLFSCGFFSYCTQTVLSPTNTQTPTFPPPESHPPPPPPPPSSSSHHLLPPRPQSESESSSSSTSQSFTQWRFPLPKSPILHHQPPPTSESYPRHESTSDTSPESGPTNLAELYHVAELQLSTGSDASHLSTLHLLERSLLSNPPADGTGDPTCPLTVMTAVVGLLKHEVAAKPATKVLLALCLAERNRHVAVEAGAVAEVVEALAKLEGGAAERALAALELLCTVPEGAAEVRAHALAVPMLMVVMGKMTGRGKECAISVLSVIFGVSGGGETMEVTEAVGRAVMLALQSECSARGRRKGAQLLKALQEDGRLDFTEERR